MFTSVKPPSWPMFACARDLSPEFEVLFLDVIIFVVLSTNAASQDGGSDSMGSFRLARAPGLGRLRAGESNGVVVFADSWHVSKALRLMRFLRLLRLHKMANLAASWHRDVAELGYALGR